MRDPESTEERIDRTEEAPRGKGAISLEKLIHLMSVRPREIFSLPGPRYIEEGEEEDLAVLDLSPIYRVKSEGFLSMGKSTLFDGMEVRGEVVKTYVGGREVYDRKEGIRRERA